MTAGCRQRRRPRGGWGGRIVARSHRPCLPLAVRWCTSVEWVKRIMLVGEFGLIFIPASAGLPALLLPSCCSWSLANAGPPALWLACWCRLLQWWESSHTSIHRPTHHPKQSTKESFDYTEKRFVYITLYSNTTWSSNLHSYYTPQVSLYTSNSPTTGINGKSAVKKWSYTTHKLVHVLCNTVFNITLE